MLRSRTSPSTLGALLTQHHMWVVRVERASCPFCIRSRRAWDAFVARTGGRTVTLDRESVPKRVRSVATVPRYLLVARDGRILKAFGDSRTSAQSLAEVVRAELSAAP